MGLCAFWTSASSYLSIAPTSHQPITWNGTRRGTPCRCLQSRRTRPSGCRGCRSWRRRRAWWLRPAACRHAPCASLLRPDRRQCLGGRALVGARAKGFPWQLGHHRHDVGAFLRSLGVERRLAVGHGTNAAKVLAHHEERALAVFDGVFGFGELGRGRGRQNGCGGGNDERGKFFMVGLPWVLWVGGRGRPVRSMPAAVDICRARRSA